jgi:vancomycin resistance protein YoaR
MKKDNEHTLVVIFFVFIFLLFLIFAYNMYVNTNSLNNNIIDKNINIKKNENVNVYTDNNINKEDMNINVKKIEPVETEVSSFSTNIYDKDDNRVYNIALAISKLNGVILKAGDTFSFNNTIRSYGRSSRF